VSRRGNIITNSGFEAQKSSVSGGRDTSRATTWRGLDGERRKERGTDNKDVVVVFSFH